MSVYKKVPVEKLICTTGSTTSGTINTYVISSPQRSVFSFCTQKERAAEIELNNQLLFARRLSMSLSNEQKNLALENFILAAI